MIFPKTNGAKSISAARAVFLQNFCLISLAVQNIAGISINRIYPGAVLAAVIYPAPPFIIKSVGRLKVLPNPTHISRAIAANVALIVGFADRASSGPSGTFQKRTRNCRAISALKSPLLFAREGSPVARTRLPGNSGKFTGILYDCAICPVTLRPDLNMPLGSIKRPIIPCFSGINVIEHFLVNIDHWLADRVAFGFADFFLPCQFWGRQNRDGNEK